MLTQHFSECKLKTTYIRISRDLNQKMQFSGPLPRFTKSFKRRAELQNFYFRSHPGDGSAHESVRTTAPKPLIPPAPKDTGTPGLYKQVPSEQPAEKTEQCGRSDHLPLKYTWKQQGSVETELTETSAQMQARQPCSVAAANYSSQTCKGTDYM